MRFMGRLFPSFGGYRYTSPYFYTPPKKRWWPFLTGCALGGVVVLLIVGKSEQPADSNHYRVSVYQTRGSQTHKLTSKKISKSATERAQAQPEKPPVDVVTAAEAASNVPATTPPETADQPTTPPLAADQSTRPAPTAGGGA
jgi:apolipoprotein N-acyltransferase